jgi:hypothetical protein
MMPRRLALSLPFLALAFSAASAHAEPRARDALPPSCQNWIRAAGECGVPDGVQEFVEGERDRSILDFHCLNQLRQGRTVFRTHCPKVRWDLPKMEIPPVCKAWLKGMKACTKRMSPDLHEGMFQQLEAEESSWANRSEAWGLEAECTAKLEEAPAAFGSACPGVRFEVPPPITCAWYLRSIEDCSKSMSKDGQSTVRKANAEFLRAMSGVEDRAALSESCRVARDQARADLASTCPGVFFLYE